MSTRELLYILSPSYSGSTLLTILLADHPRIATVGELKASSMGDPGQYFCSCGSILCQCSFWSSVEQEMNARARRFSLNRFGTHLRHDGRVFGQLATWEVRHSSFRCAGSWLLRAWPPFRSKLSAVLEQNRLLIDLITRIQRGQIFLDASKDPERLVHFQKSSFWNIKAIHLMRDGRGVANSYMKHNRVGMAAAVREWSLADLACKRARAVLPQPNVLTVRYEDLCRNPREMRNSIVRFAGLPAENNGNRSRSNLHILGNEMRLAASRDIRCDEKWRHELCAADLHIFEKAAGVANRENGYE